jgi:putative nucleotidyltransferase with HDIG domain
VAESPREFAARRYIPHSMLVGTLIVVVPILAAPLLMGLFTSQRSPWLTAILMMVLATAVSRLGSWLWQRLPGTRHIAFAELMPWTLLRLLRAEKRLVEATGRLGFDRRGKRCRPALVSTEEQKKLLRALNRAVESKDLYTLGHTRRVSRHSYSLAKKLRLPLHEVEKVRVAADVHDVGKTHVPDEILRKPDRLTDHEYAIMKKHSEVGAEIVACLGDDELTRIVRAHHERWDGRGYPDGLAGTDIPLGARIIAVADTYDAITTTRSYRTKSSYKKAIRILREESGRQFDPKVVDAFVSERPYRVAGSAFLPQQVGRWMLSLFESAGARAIAHAAVLGGAAVIGAATFAPHLMSGTLVRDRAAVGQTFRAGNSVLSNSGSNDAGTVSFDDESVSDAGNDPSPPLVGGGRGGDPAGEVPPGSPDSGAPGSDGGSPGAGGSNDSTGGAGYDGGGGDASSPKPNPSPGGDLPDLPGVPDLPDVPELPVPDLPDIPAPDLPDLPDAPDVPLPELPDLPGLP